MNNKGLQKYLLGAIVPILILVGMTILPLATLWLGESIALETRPVDPRDMFRGDYVILRYEIEEIERTKLPTTILEHPKDYRNEELYAILKQQGDHYEVDYVATDLPSKGIALKCRLNGVYELLNDNAKNTKIHLDYNLDRYFVPENTGKGLEDLARDGQLRVQLKVFRGHGIVTDVLNNEE